MKTFDSIIITSECGGIIKTWIGETKYAEIYFDRMIEDLLSDDVDEFKNIIDYSFKFVKVKSYLKTIGFDIFWTTEQQKNVVYE